MKDRLPKRLRSGVGRKMTDAYHAASALEAETALRALAKELERTHPGAAASLRQGLDETLTVLRLRAAYPRADVALDERHRVMISVCREHAANVKRCGTGRWRCVGAPPE